MFITRDIILIKYYSKGSGFIEIFNDNSYHYCLKKNSFRLFFMYASDENWLPPTMFLNLIRK